MITLGAAKTKLAEYADPDRLPERINLACELLLTSQNHKGSLERVVFNVTNGLLTLPRQYFGCLGATVSDWPTPIYNHWYEFVGGGPGTQDAVYGSVVDLGDGWVTHTDVLDVNEDGAILRVESELPEDDGQEILFRGTDATETAIWTTVGGIRLEGEYVAMDTGGNNTASIFTSIRYAQKPVTKGRVNVYAVGSSNVLLATYDPAEERPSYRRYRVPNCGDETQTVVALCQRRFVEVTNDNDPLPVDNWNALTNAMLSLQYRDRNDMERAEQFLSKAKILLSDEARRFHPASSFPSPINMPGVRQITSFY